MRKILKGAEPASLTQWKIRNHTATYRDLPAEERQSVRTACITEQFGLCAYCCQSISVSAAHNEHVAAQDTFPARTLDFSNIVASCENRLHCGHGRKTQPLKVTPFMTECETELKFYLSGRVVGKTDRATESIKTLNLGDTEESNRGLIEKRKRMVDDLIFTGGLRPDGLEDEELLGILLEDLLTPQAGLLQPFSPVLVNVIRQILP
ncbi:TIGR02646 family protein [Pseudomonas sp. AKS31]|uniref:TIGR02646 family protein n=1 Tax=Pseudomonas sp. AKS31 TaxID=2949091 RepID=UPI002029CE14|nr:TIGR02646 family protein [Pseudomonas sp. AKS31]